MSSIAPPPTGGGNTKYAVVVVLLLAGLGGLFWMRSRSDNAGQVVIRTPDAATPVLANPHQEDDLPPPPPPMPEAGPDTGPKITSTGGGGSPCSSSAKCSGGATDELQTALQFRARQAHACYDSALANDSSLKGKIAINVRIASNGQVCSAGVASNDMGSPAVAQCVANKFRQTGFLPAPKGGCVDLNVPMNFVPGGK